MKIATWNIERLKHKNGLNLILDEIKSVNADILVLTNGICVEFNLIPET